MGIDVGRVLAGALHDLRRAWRPLLGVYVVYRLVAFAALAPLAGITLQAFLALSRREVVADEDILVFARSPAGAVGLFLAAVLSVGVLALEQACLVAVGSAALRGRRPSVARAVLVSARRAGPVLLAVAHMTARLLPLAVPLVAVVVVVQASVLDEFDVNYYLAERPAVFRRAVLLVGGVLVVTVLAVLARVVDWILVLPLVLFEGVAPRRALAESRERSRADRWRIRAMVLGWAAAGMLASALVGWIVRWIGRAVTPGLRERTEVLVVLLGALVVVWAAGTLLVMLLNAASFAVLTVRLHAALGGAAPAEPAADEPRAPVAAGRRRSTRRVLGGGLVAAAAVSGTAVWLLLRDIDAADADVAVIAHRGASRAAPENTLAAVERAIEDGADQVEIDVQQTADGEVVVIHDRDLMRMAGVALEVTTTPLARLREVDLGARFSAELAGERVPTLEEVLRACSGRAGVTIELKYYGPEGGLAARVVEIVEEMGAEGEIEIMSLQTQGLDAVRALRPGWRTGLLAAAKIGRLSSVDASFLAVQHRVATPAFLAAAHAAGKDVYVWTVNDVSRMARAVRAGVDGLITDEPALARAVLQRWGELDEIEHLLLRLAILLDVLPAAPEPDHPDPSEDVP